MKQGIDKIKKAFRSLLKGGGYRLGENPSTDWIFAFIGFFVLALLIVLLTISYSPAVPPPPVPESIKNSSSLISEELMDRVVKHYDVRHEQFESLIKNPVSLPDPSL